VRPSGRVDRQLAGLGTGVRSVVITPDEQARAAIGRNPLDPGRRAPAARAGRAQAARTVDAVRAGWR
jgi:NTE family protein